MEHNEMRNDNLDNRVDAERRTGFGSMGIMVALALAIGLGLLFWGMSDRTNTVASNTAPAVTTGSSTTPSPSNPPTVKSPVGQGESNSTR
jgi:hypothetical protein